MEQEKGKKAGLPAYGGNGAYGFISYAHRDLPAALPILEALYKEKYRFWYDEGIEAGKDWPEVIAARLSGASLVLVLYSKAFSLSQNCAREVNFATDRKKALAVVSLDGSRPQGAMGMQLSVAPLVMGPGKAPEKIIGELQALSCLKESLLGDGSEGYGVSRAQAKKKLNRWALAAVLFAGLFAAALVFAVGLLQGWFSGSLGVGLSSEVVSYADPADSKEVTVTTWSDPGSRDLLLAALQGESLYAAGSAFVTSAEAVSYKNGVWLIAGKPAERGDISDLSVIAKKTGLTALSLVYQQITDISSLQALTELSYLDLSGNDISDLSPLASLTKLKVIKLLHVSAIDLTVLKSLPALEKVYLSFDRAEQAKEILDSDFDIIIKE